VWVARNEQYRGSGLSAVLFGPARLRGFASHSPGGLGVFDATMLVALWQFDTEDLVAGLLLFRLLYYLVPFGLSLAILGGREVWLSVRAAQRRKSYDQNHDDRGNSDKSAH